MCFHAPFNFNFSPNFNFTTLCLPSPPLQLACFPQRLFEEEKQRGDEGKKKKKKSTGNDFYRIVFKVHMYFDPAPEDKAAAHEMYTQVSVQVGNALAVSLIAVSASVCRHCYLHSARTSFLSLVLTSRSPHTPILNFNLRSQAVYDVVSARYPCGERDCLALAALQLQVRNLMYYSCMRRYILLLLLLSYLFSIYVIPET